MVLLPLLLLGLPRLGMALLVVLVLLPVLLRLRPWDGHCMLRVHRKARWPRSAERLSGMGSSWVLLLLEWGQQRLVCLLTLPLH